MQVLFLGAAEQPDETRSPLGVAVQLGEEFCAGEAGRQRGWLEVRGDQRESVMVQARAGRRARTGVMSQPRGAFAGDKLVRKLARFAFGEAGCRNGDAVGGPGIAAGPA